MYVKEPETRPFPLRTVDKHRLLTLYINRVFPHRVDSMGVYPGFRFYCRVDTETTIYREAWTVTDNQNKTHLIEIFRIDGKWQVIKDPKFSHTPLPGYVKVDNLLEKGVVVLDHAYSPPRAFGLFNDIDHAKESLRLIREENGRHYAANGFAYSIHPVKWQAQ